MFGGNTFGGSYFGQAYPEAVAAAPAVNFTATPSPGVLVLVGGSNYLLVYDIYPDLSVKEDALLAHIFRAQAPLKPENPYAVPQEWIND